MYIFNAIKFRPALSESLFIRAFILLLPFQDTALQGTFLKFLGASPAFIPLLLLLLFRSFRIRASTILNRFSFYLVSMVVLLTLLVSCYSVFLYMDKYRFSFLMYKIFSESILYFLAFYAIFFMKYKNFDIGNLVVSSFFIAIGGFISTTFFHLHFFEYGSIFNFTPNSNLRPRGFSMEASDFGATIGSLALLSAHYAKKYFKPIILIIGSGAVFLCFSKGSAAALITSAFFVFLYKFFHENRLIYRKLIVYVFLFFVVLIGFFVGYNYVLNMLTQSLPTTTIPTRVTMIVTALYISLISPLGVGFSGVVPAVSQSVPYVVHFLQNMGLNNLDYTEVLGYVDDPTGRNISAKNFLFTGLIIWGIPFVIFYIWFNAAIFVRLWKYNNSPYLFGAFIFSLVAISTYEGLLNLYCLSVVYGVLYETCFWQGINRNA